MNEKGGTE
jgi:hypothetical protein